jgi:NAD-dependent dihydropyrimidine dehydrogenase PreA subunit
MTSVSALNTLAYDASLCANCGRCSEVCPHAVFAPGDRVAEVARPEACMECGACQQNCPAGAIQVDSGVGCAYALMRAALAGKEECTCCGGGDDDAACC